MQRPSSKFVGTIYLLGCFFCRWLPCECRAVEFSLFERTFGRGLGAVIAAYVLAVDHAALATDHAMIEPGWMICTAEVGRSVAGPSSRSSSVRNCRLQAAQSSSRLGRAKKYRSTSANINMYSFPRCDGLLVALCTTHVEEEDLERTFFFCLRRASCGTLPVVLFSVFLG